MNRLARLAVATATFALASVAHAATDGDLAENGAASEGSTDIQLVKSVSVQITALDDLDMGMFARLDEAVTATDEVCVFASGLTYFVTASSASGAFNLTGTTDGEIIPYTVSWGGEELAADTQITTAQTGTDDACPAEGNASYTVSVAAADFNAVGYDTYTDTLTLSVVPE